MKRFAVCMALLLWAGTLTACAIPAAEFGPERKATIMATVTENKDLIFSVLDELEMLPEDTDHVGYSDVSKLKIEGPPKGLYRAVFHAVNFEQYFTYETIEFDALEEVFTLGVVKEIYVNNREEDYVDFFCAGTGFVTGMGYYGFYYSKDDAPKKNFDFFSEDEELLEEDGDGWGWNVGESKYYYTERICEQLFYYVAQY